MRKNRIALVAALGMTVLSAVECSDSPSPNAPDPAKAPSASSTGGALSTAFADRTPGVVRDRDVVAAWAAQSGWAMASGLAVEGTASISAVSGTCPEKSITIVSVPVTVNSSTTFGAGIDCAGLTTGTTVHVVGLLTVGSNGLSVVATNITLPSSDGGGKSANEVSGTAASVSGTCPAIAITLEGTGGVVKASSSTTFDPADACASIKAGTKIEAHGTRNSSGQLEATSIEVDDEESGHGHGGRVGGEGTVASLTGTCPTLRMVIRGVRVATDASTTFENGECGNLRAGTKVVVDGETQSDGSVLAANVRITDQPGGSPIEGEGTVGSVKGVCPTLTMVVHGYPVMTTSETTFSGGECSAIHAGTRIRARGTIAGGSVLASEVEIKAPEE